MPLDLNIRKYRNNDIHIILNLNKVAMQKLGVYKESDEFDMDLKDIHKNYCRNGGIFLVGTINEIIVSMGAFRKIDNNIAEIKRMGTYPEYQSRGYGEKVLIELIRIAKQYKYKELILETSEKQISARKLYTKLGFIDYKDENINGFKCTWYKLLIA